MAKGGMIVLLALSLCLMTVPAERENKSRGLGGILWATGKDEREVLAVPDPSPVDDRTDEFAGGFSSLDGMLQWGIGHSDPEKLREVARLSADELKRRRLEIRELMEELKTPTDAELMQIAIADLNNSSLSLEDRQRALNELLILVEHIDNANDLHELGGLVAIIHELYNPETEIRKTAAWILGMASQNNPPVQEHIIELGAFTKLMEMVKSSFTEEAIKALYAISALIRNHDMGQELFFSENGDIVLQDIMSNSSTDIRLQKKAAFLVADLADYQLSRNPGVKFPFFSNHLLLKSVVDLSLSSDIELSEKALLATRSLLQLSSTDASVLKNICDLNGVLDRLKDHLEKLVAQEELKDYARDIESLGREVSIVFHKKLEKEIWVPT